MIKNHDFTEQNNITSLAQQNIAVFWEYSSKFAIIFEKMTISKEILNVAILAETRPPSAHIVRIPILCH